MRSRSDSGIRLDYYQRLVNESILKYQSPATGLISGNENSHSWVRDNVYCIMAVWGMALAYRKNMDLDEDRAKAYELEKAVVSAMRGLLRSMMMQSDKVEAFKRTQSPRDALHAKYNSDTGKPVVGDFEWGHLQIDATSLYLLGLAQMTASGVIIIFTLDEVAFIQNLVFYIEAAYRTPDYGIWERGDKTNHGLPELNASSIGMAKAALEAINELDLFGSRGGPASVIHVLPDEAQQCQAILQSMLPRESISKETDAALLTVISFPAFAVDDPEIIAKTHATIKQKLEGPYGFARFLRDGYKTAREDPRRLHYEPSELMVFESIESQWPLFFAFMVLDGLFTNNKEQVTLYSEKLHKVLVKDERGVLVVPELYAVPTELVEKEYACPGSQMRVAQGKIPHMWGQSMYILGRLMIEGYLSPGELDPLNRRHVTETKPDIVVQVVLLAEDSHIQDKMALHGVDLQTVAEVAPIQIHPARVLSKIYSLLGKNKKMGLSGRVASSETGLLATSKLYMLHDKILAFVPQFMDLTRFYVVLDTNFLIDFLRTEVAYLKHSWKALGRPIVTITITHQLLDNYQHPPQALLATIKKLQTGYISGTRVHLGKLSDFLNTSCVTKLNFLTDLEDQFGNKDRSVIDFLMRGTDIPRSRLLSDTRMKSKPMPRGSIVKGASFNIQGIVRRSRSIQIDPDEIPDQVRNVSITKSSEILLSDSSTSVDAVEIERGSLGTHHLKDDTDMTESPNTSNQPSPRSARKHLVSTSERDDTDVTELVEQLKDTTNLQEQADIIHYLFVNKGPDWDTHMEESRKVPVKELLVELYEKAGHWKQWWLVRHTAGMLRKRVEDLALAATDLLVRQKQLSVGLPPDNETTINSPLPPDELAAIIYEACGADHSTASLTQELLVYLAMFIRTEPQLFGEMLRLRIGLIVQVMASELSRTLQCSGDEASDHLLNLSPFEMKTLLHHILSGKEFVINSVPCEVSETKLSVRSLHSHQETSRLSRISYKHKLAPDLPMLGISSVEPTKAQQEEEEIADRQGQWLRRRRLDGSLNRVPVGFYPLLWELLRRCRGLLIKGHSLPGTLTREMTKGEFKFALTVEMVLNRIPQPEYRQLMVEAMMVLTMLLENDGDRLNLAHLDIEVDKVVEEANSLFIQDLKMPPAVIEQATSAAGICLFFYDSAPSGRFGSMAYMCRALANILNFPISPENVAECAVS